jgi:hypothetical protein
VREAAIIASLDFACVIITTKAAYVVKPSEAPAIRWAQGWGHVLLAYVHNCTQVLLLPCNCLGQPRYNTHNVIAWASKVQHTHNVIAWASKGTTHSRHWTTH